MEPKVGERWRTQDGAPQVGTFDEVDDGYVTVRGWWGSLSMPVPMFLTCSARADVAGHEPGRLIGLAGGGAPDLVQ